MNDSEYMIIIIFFLQYHHRDTESYIHRYIVVAIFFLHLVYLVLYRYRKTENYRYRYTFFGDIELFNARISLL